VQLVYHTADLANHPAAEANLLINRWLDRLGGMCGAFWVSHSSSFVPQNGKLLAHSGTGWSIRACCIGDRSEDRCSIPATATYAPH
jgi:hypothetical protein